MEFAYDGGGLAKGGNVVLYIDGKPIGHGHINATVPMIDRGRDLRCGLGHRDPGEQDYTSAGSTFMGTVNWVQLDIGDDSHDHLITPEELIRVATAIQ